MSQLALDLPTSRPEPEAVATAAAELYERGIDDFTHLELRTTHATGTALIRRFTFTYWTPTTKALPHTISYVELWARLGHPHQTALLTLGHTAAITEPVREGLIHAAGEDFLLRDIWGNHHLPGELPGLPQHHRPRTPIARHPTYIPYIVTPQLVTTLVGADFHSAVITADPRGVVNRQRDRTTTLLRKSVVSSSARMNPHRPEVSGATSTANAGSGPTPSPGCTATNLKTGRNRQPARPPNPHAGPPRTGRRHPTSQTGGHGITPGHSTITPGKTDP